MPKKKLSQKDLHQEILMLERITNALNTAVVALAYAVKVKGDELDGVNSDDYVKYVKEHVHPLVRRADEIVAEAAKKASEKAEAEKAKEDTKEEE